MVYGDFKDLPKRADFDYVILNKAFNIPKNLKYDEHQGDLASMIYKFSDKKFLVMLLHVQINMLLKQD